MQVGGKMQRVVKSLPEVRDEIVYDKKGGWIW
jgi:hypothetical protein